MRFGVRALLAGALPLALAMASCSSGGGKAGPSGTGSAAASGSHMTVGCSTDVDCAASVPQTVLAPGLAANCAAGKCNVLQGLCEYVATDEDGDGHAAANCRSTNGVPIQQGDDCNDQDPNLYPGHPESCSTTEDGGIPEGALCASGNLTCQPDGTESACVGTVACANAACVAGACMGGCAPGQTRCVDPNSMETCLSNGTWGTPTSCASATCVAAGGSAQCEGACDVGAAVCAGNNGVETCTSTGTWGSAVPCVNQTCSNGACVGSCAPGQSACADNGVATCSVAGTWISSAACGSQTCVYASLGESPDAGAIWTDGASGVGVADATGGPPSVVSVSASCQGVCAAGQLGCSGQEPQVCDTSGQWRSAGAACSASTPVCSQGMCVTCTPNGPGCDGTQPQTCNGSGTAWMNTGSPCTGETSACLNGACVACNPEATQCSNNGVQTCGSLGQWSAGLTCGNQTCVQSGMTTTCAGSCAPGQQTCSANTVWACNSTGAYAPSRTCPNQTCIENGTTAACMGQCAPGQTRCFGNGVETCGSSGQWNSAAVCSGATSFCANGACSPTPASCQTSGAGLSNCGASPESCCTTLSVAGGTYDRTFGTFTAPADPATVSEFRLDKYLVTVGRFRQFVIAWNGGAGYTPPGGSGKHTHLNNGNGLAATGGGYEPGWVTSDNVNVAPTNVNLCAGLSDATWTSTVSGNENLPINFVTWWEAYAFCIWDGGFLPSEAEWEYAAAGGAQQRLYPWGSTAPGPTNQYAIYGDGAGKCYYPSGSLQTCTLPGVANIAPVGFATLGAGLWGQLDLAGEMWEWNLDWGAPYVACTDCADLTASSGRVVRGGDSGYPTSGLLSANRVAFPPTVQGDMGFRCARTP